MSDELKGIVKPGSVPAAQTPDGAKLFRPEDLEESVSARHRELQESLREPKHARELAAAAEFPGWEYAIANDALPQDADAAIVRDPDASVRRILVFNKERLNDRLVSLARIALAFTEGRATESGQKQVVLVWSDGHIEVNGKKESLGAVSVVERGDSAAIGSRKGKAVQISGIGGVQIIGGAEKFK